MKIPKPSKADKEIFESLLPNDPRVSRRLVFGNDAAFVKGNMFFGIYGPDLFVRLPEDRSKELLKEKGAGPFEPVPGHAMGGYFVFPKAWRSRPSEIRKWIDRSLEWASSLPEKKAKR